MAYQKQTWREYDYTKTELQNINNGAAATPERLNHMENGIANSADKATLQQLEVSVTQQLQQITHQVSTFDELKNAITLINLNKSGAIKVEKDIEITEPILIADVHYFELDTREFKLIDAGYQIEDKDGLLVGLPFGFEIKNTAKVTIKAKLDNRLTTIGSLKLSDFSVREPQLYFNGCDDVDVDLELFGTVGAYCALGMTPNIVTADILPIIKSCYVTFYNSNNIRVKQIKYGNTLNGGEPFGMYMCKDIIIDYQNSDSTGGWSMGKLIKCNLVTHNKASIISVLNGNEWDVSGRDITFRDIYVDKPFENIGVFDITGEFGGNGGDSSNVTFRDIWSNCGLVESSVLKGVYPNINKVVIDNVTVDRRGMDMTVNTKGVNYNWFKDTTIINSDFYNVRNPLSNNEPWLWDGTVTDLNNYLSSFQRTVNVRDCNFYWDRKENTSVLSIAIGGILTIDNCRFYRDMSIDKQVSELRFADVYSLSQGATYAQTTSDSPTKIVVRNTKFENFKINIASNISFEKCEFINCVFNHDSSGTARTGDILFDNCEFEFTVNSESISNNGSLFHLNNIIFKNCLFKGQTKNSLSVQPFRPVDVENSEIVMEDCGFEVKMMNQENVEVDYTIFNNSNAAYRSIEIYNSKMSERIKLLYCVNITSAPLDMTIKIKNCELIHQNTVHLAGFNSLNSMNMQFIGNILPAGTSTQYNLSALEYYKDYFADCILANNIPV